jgi:hypothetical protein
MTELAVAVIVRNFTKRWPSSIETSTATTNMRLSFFGKVAELSGTPSYAKRFAAYELSHCEGRAREAYDRLDDLCAAGDNERLPTLIRR